MTVKPGKLGMDISSEKTSKLTPFQSLFTGDFRESTGAYLESVTYDIAASFVQARLTQRLGVIHSVCNARYGECMRRFELRPLTRDGNSQPIVIDLSLLSPSK